MYDALADIATTTGQTTGARYYDAGLGRFISRSVPPFGLVRGEVKGIAKPELVAVCSL